MEKAFAFVHFDVFDENSVLGYQSEFKTLADAIVYLKHHPATLASVFEYPVKFDPYRLQNVRLVATKKDSVITKLDDKK